MTMKRNTVPAFKGLLAVAGISLMAAGCSTHTTFVDYGERGMYSSDNTGNMPYIEVGPVTGKASGYVWDNCDALIAEALDEARMAAEENAANAMIGVRWVNHAEGTFHDTPMCTTRWGWFTLAGVGGLHPWVKVAEFEGRLVYADSEALNKVRGGKVDFRDTLEEKRQEELRQRMQERREREEAKAAAKAAEEAEEQAEAEADAESEADDAEAED